MQSKIDSLMEALVNIVIGLVVSTIANHWVLPAVLGVSMSLGQNVLIGAIFTAISLARSYVLRRLFNGRSVWEAIKESPMFGLFRRKKPEPVRVTLPTALTKGSSSPSPRPCVTSAPAVYAPVPSYRPTEAPTPSYDPFPAYMAAAVIDTSPSYDSSPSYSSYDSSSSYSSSSSDSGSSSGGGDFGGGGSSGDW